MEIVDCVVYWRFVGRETVDGYKTLAGHKTFVGREAVDGVKQ